MLIKIYFETTPLVLTDAENRMPTALSATARKMAYRDATPQQIQQIINDLYQGNSEPVVLISEDGDALQEAIFKYFECIDAAGGIVQNLNKDLLFIFRKGKWDLPKGKMELGEDAAECAQREVVEETGIQPLEMIYPVGTTYHAYREKGKNILKTSYWFYFTTHATTNGTPQTEEDITQVKWIATRDLKKPMKQSYETIKEILNAFFDRP
ncbi:MAG: NUDIX domain-containing protein [Ferruginibacter sp.]|nr:NUDIX domain-containing protein [Ferruginibacter sp.]